MARIDKFIQAGFQAEADKIVIATDDKATLYAKGAIKNMTQQAATRQQIMEIFNEVAPSDGATALSVAGQFDFTYDSPSGPVKLIVQAEGEMARMEISYKLDTAAPAPEDAPAPPSPLEIPLAEAGEETVIETTEGIAVPHVSSPPAPDPSIPVPAATAPQPQAQQIPQPVEAQQAPPVQPAPVMPAAVPMAPPISGFVARPPNPAGVQKMETLFKQMVIEGCSDLHMTSGTQPLFRKDGNVVSIGNNTIIPAQEMDQLIHSITPAKGQEEFQDTHDADFAYEIPGVARFRCNMFMDRQGVGGVFRVIPSKIPSAEDLGLNDATLNLCKLTKGLVLVTGPTGSGKSTTLAAMIDYINVNRTEHIITIEDPIEFVHPRKKCLINQREVGVHTAGFKSALRAALREDPDIILVGELRDLETIAIAIETAETGHLVFGTLHTNSAPSTVDRVIDQFSADRQSQIRTMLSESLKGVISQTLCRKKGGGRVAAHEILLVTAAISNLIREGKTFQIPSMMQTGKGIGMKTMNDSLLELVKAGTIEEEEALAKAIDRAALQSMLGRKSAPAGAAAGGTR